MKPIGPRLAMSVVVRVMYATRSGAGAPETSPAMSTGTIASMAISMKSNRKSNRQSNGFHQRYRGPRSICW